MIKAAKKSAIAQKNGALGGNPTLSKQTASGALDNQARQPPLESPVPEARKKKEKTPAAKAAIPLSEPDFFPDFWRVYPRRVDKGHARVAWDRAIKDTNPAEIIRAAQRFADQCVRDGTDPHFIAHAATWLNGQRWTDEFNELEINDGSGNFDGGLFGNPNGGGRGQANSARKGIIETLTPLLAEYQDRESLDR
jgi:hypothetical protein